jgi:RimJ/RimL family protein N-acetyltransferase
MKRLPNVLSCSRISASSRSTAANDKEVEIVILKTNRLILRPWEESDAESLYEYAKSPLVGPAAGWPVHTSVENSRQIIREVLSADETYAVTIKDDGSAIGSVGLLIGDKSDLTVNADEAEIGYWIGAPYWGQGLIPEAVRELMRYAFDDLGISTLWCGYFDDNEKSKRVNEKCGFRFHHTENNKECPLINETKTQHVTCVTKRQS